MKSSYPDEPVLNPSTSVNDELRKLEGHLSTFRDEWKKEIATEIDESNQLKENAGTENGLEETEMLARNFFMEGAEHEKKGRMYEAIQNYRKAVQLVPDIEYKIFEATYYQNEDQRDDSIPVADVMENNVEEDGDIETTDLYTRFLSKSATVCVPAQKPEGAHFSSLPIEITLLIFRWVVSKDLDVRSLEMCSLVCRGFYLCSRDSELWRSICNRQFGIDCGKLDNSLSWRDTYLGKPHLDFNGCYISKASYYRQGEKCFQDQFHRPWHVVEYYRYLRFFADGVAIMLTTPDAPGPVLNHLRHRNPKLPSALVGKFKLSEDRVNLVFIRNRSTLDQLANRRRGRRCDVRIPEYQQEYNIELLLRPPKGRKSSSLVWIKYTAFTISNFTDTMANFDLPPNKFPPFSFSRVKSYSLESDSQL